MTDDLVQILLYVVIGIIGVIASAYQNKQKKKQAANQPLTGQVTRDKQARDMPDIGPDLGPLMDIFDLPRTVQTYQQEKTVEEGPSVEEGGMLVDVPESSIELAGMKMAEEGKTGEEIPKEETFEEGQSDIQRMIARYDAIRRELEQEYDADDIASGEIVSLEEEEAAQSRLPARERIFEPRKAIIYSEILKRREY